MNRERVKNYRTRLSVDSWMFEWSGISDMSLECFKDR
jgi:hypothetical protein